MGLRQDLRGIRPPTAEPMSVVMWTAPNCPQCRRTQAMLTRHDVPVTVKALDDSILAFAEEAGFREAPVVLGVRPDGTSEWWSGMDFERIAEFVGLARKAANNA
ncbi:glutaredoxin family protein [Corynebacterium hansenii]|uniref:Glutaredoxin family protein n=1 Tax=Corynebacterium hansenii TaxID=394964 RepID=A0ABV7ZSA4_9CORY|nr:glutaredoxin family protein [Corynebacterium hansenii]WJZ00689.1 Regulatory protein Spx [Corynebacterium hansenii]